MYVKEVVIVRDLSQGKNPKEDQKEENRGF